MNIQKPTKYLILFFLLFAILVLFYFFKFQPKLKDNMLSEELSFTMFTPVDISEGGQNIFIKNYNLTESMNKSTSLNFYVSEDPAIKVPVEITKQFQNNGWNTVKELGHEGPLAYSVGSWEKSTKKATVVVFEDLDSVGIEGFKNNYGIENIAPHNTLFVVSISEE